MRIGGHTFRQRLLVLLLVWAAATIATGAAGAQETPSEIDRALLQAAFSGDPDLVLYALERGANPEARGPDGETPLHLASLAGNPDVVSLLLDHGADPAAVTALQVTALHHAADAGHAAVVRLLIAAGTPLEAREARYGNTALHMAARRGHRAALAALLAGDDIEAGREGRGAGQHGADSGRPRPARPLRALGTARPRRRSGGGGR